MRTRLLPPLLLLATACARKEDPPPPPPAPAPAVLTVKAVTLGRALAVDNRVVQATDTFGARDTIHASVETEGAADRATLAANWTYHGPKGPVPVFRNTLDLAQVAGPSFHAFHVTRKTDWPKGAYQVEIFLNGAGAMRKDFTVK